MWIVLPGIVGLHLVMEMIDRQRASEAFDHELQVLSQVMAQVHERHAAMAQIDPSLHGSFVVSPPAPAIATTGFAAEIIGVPGDRLLLTHYSLSVQDTGMHQALASELLLRLPTRRNAVGSGSTFTGRYFAAADGKSRVGDRFLSSKATLIANGSAVIATALE